MLVLIAGLKARPDSTAEVAEALRGMVVASRREPGTLAYGFCQENGQFTVTEYYRDASALQAHMDSPALKAFLAKVSGLLEGTPTTSLSTLQEGFGFGDRVSRGPSGKRHFIVSLGFKIPFEQFGDAVPRHRAFLQEGYDQGLLLMSGPREPRTGGVVLARADSLEALQTFFSHDPYLLEGLAEHVFQEFLPVKHQAFLEEWIQGA